jgi:hypothetical protein
MLRVLDILLKYLKQANYIIYAGGKHTSSLSIINIINTVYLLILK